MIKKAYKMEEARKIHTMVITHWIGHIQLGPTLRNLAPTWAPRCGQQGPSWHQVGLMSAPGPIKKGMQET